MSVPMSRQARRPAFRRRILWLLLLGGLCLASRTPLATEIPTGQTAANAQTAPREITVDYVGPWAYKWGDSTRDESGTLRWLARDIEFTPLGKQGLPRPPGRNGARFLWLRTTLDGPQLHDATFAIEIVDQLVEAYLDGQRIYAFGDLDGTRRFLGYPVHYIPLGDDYRNKTLTLRIYSDHLNIGLAGAMRIGSKSRLIIDSLQQDIGKLAVGFVLCAIGLFACVLFFSERQELAYLYYAVFAFTVGVWLLCQPRVRSLIIEHPLFFPYLENFALYTTVAALTLFLVRTMGRGPFGLMPILARIFVVYDLGAALLVATGTVGIMATLLPFQLLLAFSIIYTLCSVVILLRQGNVEARLFAIGLALAAAGVAYDLLTVVGILPRAVLSMSQFGHGGFALALGFILIRRFRLVHRDLVATKQTLSEKVQALQSRNTEFEQLNDALRHQIEARSKQLINSLLDQSSGSQVTSPIFAEGTLIGTRYRVVRLLGQGAMGVVYEVERVQDGRHFAAKVLTSRAHRRELARFAREAQVLARLKHENLVTIADVDVTDNRLAYIIMELVAGTTLADQEQRYGDLDFVLPILRQLAAALAVVHAEGVVHRDLKPSNILIARTSAAQTPMIKVVDFGVSALNAIEDTADESVQAMAPTLDNARGSGLLTQTGVIMGTPLYMAPELLGGAKLARASADIFGFGIIAYELVTGQLPSETPPIMLRLKPGARWYTALSVRGPKLPAQLAQLIERCLDVTPENRPTAAELHAAFAAAIGAVA